MCKGVSADILYVLSQECFERSHFFCASKVFFIWNKVHRVIDLCHTVHFRRKYSFSEVLSVTDAPQAALRFESMCEKIGQVFRFLEESRLYKFFMNALIYVRAEYDPPHNIYSHFSPRLDCILFFSFNYLHFLA